MTRRSQESCFASICHLSFVLGQQQFFFGRFQQTNIRQRNNIASNVPVGIDLGLHFANHKRQLSVWSNDTIFTNKAFLGRLPASACGQDFRKIIRMNKLRPATADQLLPATPGQR